MTERIQSSPTIRSAKWAALAAAVLLIAVLAERPLVAVQVVVLAIPATLPHTLLLLGVACAGYLGTRFGGDFPWWASIFAVELVNLIVLRYGKPLPPKSPGGLNWRVIFLALACFSLAGFLFQSIHPLRTALITGAWIAAAYAQPRFHFSWRTAAGNAVLLLVSVLFSIALIEGVLRLGPKPERVYLPGDGTLVAHPDLLFTLPYEDRHTVRFAPDEAEVYKEFRVDIHPPGIRNEPVPPKAEGEFRIALIGDSFTFGWGLDYEDTIGQELEVRLNDALQSPRVRVINLGVPGYGPWQEWAFLQERGFALEPDLVIAQIFPSNDLENELSREGLVLRSYFTFWQERLNAWRAFATWQLTVERWFRNNSRVYRMMYDYAPAWNLVNLLNDLRFIKPAPTLPLPPNEGRPSTLEAMHASEFEEVRHAWKMIGHTLDSIAAECQARGIAVAGYVIPMYQQMDDEAWRALRDELPAEYEAVIERFKDVEDAEAVLADSGFAVIPVADALRAVRDPREIYFTLDTHLRPAGSGLVAETIAQYLIDGGHIPGAN
jgi:hypothetical protein